MFDDANSLTPLPVSDTVPATNAKSEAQALNRRGSRVFTNKQGEAYTVYRAVGPHARSINKVWAKCPTSAGFGSDTGLGEATTQFFLEARLANGLSSVASNGTLEFGEFIITHYIKFRGQR